MHQMIGIPWGEQLLPINAIGAAFQICTGDQFVIEDRNHLVQENEGGFGMVQALYHGGYSTALGLLKPENPSSKMK